MNIQTKQAYYASSEFANELATLMIPDVKQYVDNILFCLLLASESKSIYNDIINQLSELRKKHNTYYTSFSYMVGSLFVDGRAYANRNIRNWCSELHKVSDSIMQIVNIVFDFGLKSGKIKYSNTIGQCKDSKLKDLCTQLYDELNVEICIDNQSKHRLNVETMERLSQFILKRNERFFIFNSADVSISDLLDDEREKKINVLVFDILDHILEKARNSRYPKRAYAEIRFDPEQPFVQEVELFDQCEIDKVNIVKIKMDLEKQINGTSTIKKATLQTNSQPLDTFYLALLYKCITPAGVSFYKMTDSPIDKISVIKNSIIIGYYSLIKSDDIGVHFSKYTFTSTENE